MREDARERDHARKVAVFAAEVLDQAGVAPRDLDAVAVSRGPGSYTGLRIGVSFAKGLCYALRIPLIAVDSLESLARVAAENYRAGMFDVRDWDGALLCPMIDARRMEVYAEVLDTRMNVVRPVAAEVVDGDSFGGLPSGELLIFGDGAAKCADVLSLRGARLIEATSSARGLCAPAQCAFEAGVTQDVAYFEPFYLKDFVVTKSSKKIL